MDHAGPQAAARVARTITAVAGVATLVFLGLELGPIIDAAPHLNPVFALTSAVLVFGMPVAIALLCQLLDLPAIRRALGVYAVVFVLVVLLWVPAMTSLSLPPEVVPWPAGVTALATVPAAIAWRPSVAWAYLALNSVLIAPLEYFAAGGGDPTRPLQDALFTLTFSAIFTALALVAMRSGYTLDTATEQARATAARAATAAAHHRERARLDALVHDNVMATLLYASQGNLDQSVQRQARRAIAQLGQLRGGTEQASDPMPTAVFIVHIRSVILDACPDAAFEAVGTRSTPITREVAAAFAEATSEAVRNSMTHAEALPGRDITRSVRIALDEHSIGVTVRDDGLGFDPREVPPHRLGIVVSISGRMGTLPGGSAQVESRRGEGTVVQLDWVES